jgi:putative PIN family toxin of toxin-antitoxin system
MRVVIDTNVLISATFWSGKPKQILNMVRRGEIRFITSRILLDELKDILVRDDKPFRLSESEASHIVEEFEALAEIIKPRCKVNVCRHKTDNRVLECALDGNAKWIITGDSHLLYFGSFKETEIATPADFMIKSSSAQSTKS